MTSCKIWRKNATHSPFKACTIETQDDWTKKKYEQSMRLKWTKKNRSNWKVTKKHRCVGKQKRWSIWLESYCGYIRKSDKWNWDIHPTDTTQTHTQTICVYLILDGNTIALFARLLEDTTRWTQSMGIHLAHAHTQSLSIFHYVCLLSDVVKFLFF